MRILIIGVNTRHIACSAARAGHTVHTISIFNDIDLMECASKAIVCNIPDVHNIDLDEIAAAISSLLPVDGVVLGPGFEHLEHWIRNIIDPEIPVFNNSPQIITNMSNKLWFAHKLKEMGIRHPYTLPLASIKTQEDWTAGYPATIKPITGAGGIENILVNDACDLTSLLHEIGTDKNRFLIQEFVKGTLASVSVISTGQQAVAIAVNEQLAGLGWLTRMPFAYCGNITPFESDYSTLMSDTAIKLAITFNLMGSNGVDFIITEQGPVVLEINARFQGSIDTVENATGINVFQAHIEAFENMIPARPSYRQYTIKTIFFAPRRFTVGKKVYEYLLLCLKSGNGADVPPEGTMVNINEPVVSFISCGVSRQQVIQQVNNCVDGLVDRLNKDNTED
ncbi:MAG: ATP-grasp domain-containing protein [Methanosarcinales archaeon]|nr:ATP-grasp domain-containing protein [ANME-2 cluster archaeon]MDF1530948.1 ATP-grasp domain-containing protein [ANME-2 cluster archaeon]MDW7775107.1 ATP-grasp domain-containing protein [Methanosarcinales archaeon]